MVQRTRVLWSPWSPIYQNTGVLINGGLENQTISVFPSVDCCNCNSIPVIYHKNKEKDNFFVSILIATTFCLISVVTKQVVYLGLPLLLFIRFFVSSPDTPFPIKL